jgi:hypothetical protein
MHSHQPTAATQCLDQSQPTVVVVVDHGTDMQDVQAVRVVADALHQTVQAQTVIQAPMTAVTKIWVAVA